MKDQDKKLVEDLRDVISGTREKLFDLKSEIRERDRRLFDEITRRKELERRLRQQLVDMYGDNPQVNVELREKLDLANRYEPFVFTASNDEELLARTTPAPSMSKFNNSPSDTSRSRARGVLERASPVNVGRVRSGIQAAARSALGDDVADRRAALIYDGGTFELPDAAEAPDAPGARHVRHASDGADKDGDADADADVSRPRRKRKKQKTRPDRQQQLVQPLNPYAFGAHPYSYPMPPPLPPPPPVGFYPLPAAPPSGTSQAPMLYAPASAFYPPPLVPSAPVTTNFVAGPPSSRVADVQLPAASTRLPVHLIEALLSGASSSALLKDNASLLSGAFSTAIRSRRRRRHSDPIVPATDNADVSDSDFVSSNVDPKLLNAVANGDENVSASLFTNLLLEFELRQSQEKQLLRRLVKAEEDLELAKLSQSTSAGELEARLSDRVLETMDDLYRSQKEHDIAMMHRLRLANEERDQALHRLESLQTERDKAALDVGLFEQLPADLEGNTGEKTFAELLNRLQQSRTAGEVEVNGGALAAALRQLVGARDRLGNERITSVLKERDAVLAQIASMGDQLLSANALRQEQTALRQTLEDSQSKLHSLDKDRLAALDKLKATEDELQKMTVFCQLQKSLSQEPALRERLADAHQQADSGAATLQHQTVKQAAQLRLLTDEKRHLAQQLAKAHQALQQSQLEAHRMERVVAVLRRKLASFGLQTEVDDLSSGSATALGTIGTAASANGRMGVAHEPASRPVTSSGFANGIERRVATATPPGGGAARPLRDKLPRGHLPDASSPIH